MKTVDVTFQNLDSSEISLTDVSHYFDSDPTKLVAGLRGDGKSPNAFIADTTTANAQVGAFYLVLLSCPRTQVSTYCLEHGTGPQRTFHHVLHLLHGLEGAPPRVAAGL